MTTSIGGFQFEQFGKRSHEWDEGMNRNMLKASILLHPSVISRTTALPETAQNFDCYIDPATKRICTWFDGEWKTIAPQPAAWVHVQDTNSYDTFENNEWRAVIYLDAVHPSMPRTLAFYAPGAVRPSSTIFYYVAAMEFTIPAGAPGSRATLDIAPATELIINMSIGTITFAGGSKEGVFSVAQEVVLQPTQEESQLTPAGSLSIWTPADVKGAQGLSVTIAGTLRGMS